MDGSSERHKYPEFSFPQFFLPGFSHIARLQITFFHLSFLPSSLLDVLLCDQIIPFLYCFFVVVVYLSPLLVIAVINH